MMMFSIPPGFTIVKSCFDGFGAADARLTAPAKARRNFMANTEVTESSRNEVGTDESVL